MMAAMKKMAAALCVGLLLLSCGEKKEAAEPSTPQEMYARAQELLKPNAQHDASDFAGALAWLQRAAEAGYLPAQTDLGGLYLAGGKGVKPDPVQAMRWFRAAAEQGSMPAHVFIGQLLFDGAGCSRDEKGAMEQWRMAAEAGIPEAQYRLGRVLAQHAETSSQGVIWLRKAVREGQQGGVPAAATALGNLFYTGANGVNQDLEEAARWYGIAATGGDPMAQLVYAEMLLVGEPIPRDEKRGLTMLRMAAGQDYPRAIARLINYLRNTPDAAANAGEADAWAARLQRLQARPRSAGE